MAGTSSSGEPLTITDDLIEATPIEKCSLNPRRGKNSRRLLTGFIIFASEARKEVADQYPNENFGFISRLVGDKWRALSADVRFKYHKRALIHNKRIKDLAQKEGISLGAVDLLNGSHDMSLKVDGSNSTPRKLSKKKQAKLAKQERKRLENETSNFDRSSTSQTPTEFNNFAGGSNGSFVDSSFQNQYQHQLQQNQQQYQQQQQQQQHQQHHHNQPRPSKRCSESGTQTATVNYVAPPPRKQLTFSEAFWTHIYENLYKSSLLQQMNTTAPTTS